MIDKLLAGDPIRESFLGNLVDGVNAATGMSSHSPTGADSHLHDGRRDSRAPAVTRIVRVRILADVIPSRWREANQTDSQAAGFVGNSMDVATAVRVSWSAEDADWIEDEGVYIDVMADSALPLREGDVLPVMLDPLSGLYFPFWTPPSAMIEITNDVANSEGFLEGRIKNWNSDLRQWEDGADVWVIDANRR